MHDNHVREITFFDQSYRILRVDLQNKEKKGSMVKLVSLIVHVEECSDIYLSNCEHKNK